MITNSDLMSEDLKHIFHPCSQMKDYETLPLIPIKKGKGVYLEDFDGNRYIDAISSWWVNLFGHANPTVNKRIKKQLVQLEHVIFAGFTHKPAVDLAKRLKKLVPKGLEKVFFADNGSSAIEIALKMSFHYFKNKGEVRPYFISLENSYHGETMGALAVGDVEIYKEAYGEILIRSLKAKSPSLHSESEALKDMEKVLKENASKVSAVVVEPIVQCAGSMKMYDATYLKKLRKLCDKYGVHLIADEIAVGFGRTGTMFAMEQAGVCPDFMCLSKGITAGYLPLSVTLLTEKIYEAFYCDYSEGKSFLDSHSYTGNTLACATANAVLDIFEKEDILKKNKKTALRMGKMLKRFKKLSAVKEIRQRGMIAAVEIEGFDPKDRVNLKIYQYALKKGVLLRPLGHTIYFMPPYVITKEELKKVIDTAYEAIEAL